MKVNDFLSKLGITERRGFQHTEIGENYDIAKALCEFMDSKYKLGQNEVYGGETDDYHDLEQFFIMDVGDGYELKDCINLDEILVSIWVYVFEYCACGIPREMINLVAHVMESIGNHEPDAFWRKHMYIMYDLDRIGFTEHGSSVYGSWLTTLGWAFVVLVKASDFYKPIDE